MYKAASHALLGISDYALAAYALAACYALVAYTCEVQTWT
jgi:hypothetical protein